MIKIVSKSWREIVIIVLILLMIGSIKQCTVNKQSARQAELNSDTSITLLMDKYGRDIALQNQVIVSKNSEIAKQIQKIKGLKKIKQQVRIQTVTKIVNTSIPIKEAVYINCDSTDTKYLKVPAPYSYSEQWYSLAGVITDSGYILVDSMKMFSEPIISIGLKKQKGIFNKPIPTVSYKDNNPYIKIINMSNIKIEDNRKDKKIGIGVIAGYGITKTGLSPFIGIGASYNIIKL